MKTIITYRDLWQQLCTIYGESESKAIVRTLLEDCFGMSYTDIVCNGASLMSPSDLLRLEEMMKRLRSNEPIQYITGREWFGGRSFSVGEGVLIPRPETYDLCRWIIDSRHGQPSPDGECSILDIGTGSGCIAVTLALETCHSAVTAWDISDTALKTASANADDLNANIHFTKQDALNPPADSCKWDVIVSNPPYIAQKERPTMQANVVCYEPSMALFVPDDDPLLYYHSISRYASTALKKDVALYFEINPAYAGEMVALLRHDGFASIEIRADRYGRQRMIKCIKE